MTAGHADAAEDALPARYEDALAELEELVDAMESGRLDLQSLLARYRRGSALLGHCRGQLEAVAQQVKLLEDGLAVEWRDGARSAREDG